MVNSDCLSGLYLLLCITIVINITGVVVVFLSMHVMLFWNSMVVVR